ncbi:MAG TPA: hypothetical protein VJN21_06140 [Candidatus Acidoferrales bacterium]|nr:hypothetical protein [Candidatus Acidoferrales bacterium]
MKNAIRVSLITAASLALALSAWGLPRFMSNNGPQPLAVQTQAPQTQSVSGTIASVEKTWFTLTVSSQPQSKGQPEAVQTDNPKTMKFMIDKNTTIEGALKTGSNADVTYRQDASGNNIAVSVRVTS